MKPSYIKCKNGHYYNPNDYEECPYCAYQSKQNQTGLDQINTIYGSIPVNDQYNNEKIYTLTSKDSMVTLQKSQSLTIGRDPSCDIVVDDKTVSRIHCKIFIEKGVMVLIDLGSKNGTCFNDDRIGPNEKYMIRESGLLKLGNYTFKLKKETKRVPLSSFQDTVLYEGSKDNNPLSDTAESVSSVTHCPHCGKEYKDKNDRFCRFCGYKKGASGKIRIGIPTDRQQLIYGPPPVTVHYECSFCGNKWKGSNWSMDRYCPNCGNECQNDLPENEFKRYG